ncbi:MAG: hypothetical protein QM581_06345 [Pseudomonas sp.]
MNPIRIPRPIWPVLIAAAARALRAEDCGCGELAADLDVIAAALRAEVDA